MLLPITLLCIICLFHLIDKIKNAIFKDHTNLMYNNQLQNDSTLYTKIYDLI